MRKNTYIDDIETWRKDFSFYIPIKIRFSETDMFGHMNNVSVFTYFEEARIDFMEHISLFDFHNNGDEAPIVADLQSDYLTQVYFGEPVRLFVKVAHTGKTSMDLHYMALKDDDAICFTGRGRLVKINTTTGKPVALTEKELLRLAEYSTTM